MHVRKLLPALGAVFCLGTFGSVWADINVGVTL